MAKHNKNLKDKLLDAAEAVVVREGISNLTLDAVAAEGGVSKGGLLHHFRSKDDLVKAMVTRSAENWRCYYMNAYENTPEGPGRMVRALLGSCISDSKAWTEQLRRSWATVFAALAQSQGCPESTDPSRIESMRAAYSDLYKRVAEDGLPPGVGEVAVAAIDGLWLYWVLGLVPVDPEMLDRVKKAIEEIVARSLLEPGKSSKKKRPASKTSRRKSK